MNPWQRVYRKGACIDSKKDIETHVPDKPVRALAESGEIILPCPFCGDFPIFEEYHVVEGCDVFLRCGNSECPVIVTTRAAKSREEAVAKWNSKRKLGD